MAPFHNNLKPYAVLWAGVVAELESLTEDELLELAESCTKPTSTNCWFATKHAADWIAPLVADELARRTMQTKEPA